MRCVLHVDHVIVICVTSFSLEEVPSDYNRGNCYKENVESWLEAMFLKAIIFFINSPVGVFRTVFRPSWGEGELNMCYYLRDMLMLT